MIKAIIVDDEINCCETLATLLERYCPDVNVVAVCYSGEEAVPAIQQHLPHIVFLDIEMPRMNGFQLLEKLPRVFFEIIFTTSYNQYAIKAFRVSALDYLLKPVDRQELESAVRKVTQRLQYPLSQQLEILLQKFEQPAAPIQKIALATMEGLQLVAVDSIISCESESNYTVFYLKNKQKVVVSRPLKEIEEMLEESSFLRVHNCYLVNLNQIDKYVKGKGGYLVMSDGSSIDVSRSKKELLLDKLRSRKI